MNSEEAIRILKEMKSGASTRMLETKNYNYAQIRLADCEALTMAIEALKEPFEQIKWERDMALDTLKQHGIGLGQEPKQDWIPVSEKLPEMDKDGYAHVLVCMDDEFIATTDFIDGEFELWAESGEVVAWQPLPEPYKGE